MRRLVGVGVLGVALALAPTTALAQPPQTAPADAQDDSASEDTRPATPTTSGTTGIWFVPSGTVLPHKRWSFSLHRTNMDDGQGFTDISHFPVTFAVGLHDRVEVFGSLRAITRIDRDTRPLFFTSTPDTGDSGTGGGIVPNHPLVRQQWTGNKLGDLWLGGKVNLMPVTTTSPVAFAVRGMVKLPIGDEDSGASSGKTDFQADAIISTYNDVVEIAGFGGLMVRGNPDGFELTNGLRWGIGAAFPQRYNLGLRVTAELFGERYFDNQITAPSGFLASDGSMAPISSTLSNPVIGSIGLTWQAPNGFFVGAATSWNFNMAGRSEAAIGCPAGLVCDTFSPFVNEPKDDKGFQVRIGWHPGVRRTRGGADRALAPVAPPAVTAPVAPPAPQNRPPTVTAACDPCTVQVGQTSTVSADAQDPDGDPLTYQWTTPAGTVTNPTSRQSPWTAPMQEGPVQLTVTVNDGRGGTANASTTIQVVRPREYTFEDVHFEFDRFTIRVDALRVLDDAITAMQANTALRLTIEGHTCNIGTAEYNLALGERRSQAVRDYLASRGITGDRLQTVSYGEERPRHDNAREETRRLNRRAALVVRLQ